MHYYVFTEVSNTITVCSLSENINKYSFYSCKRYFENVRENTNEMDTLKNILRGKNGGSYTLPAKLR